MKAWRTLDRYTPQGTTGRLTRHRQPRNVLESTRNCKDEADNHAHNIEDDAASTMLSQGVHHDSKRKDVAPHDEDQEEQLCSSEDFAANGTEKNLASVGHAVDVRVAHLELAQVVTGVGCENAEANDEDDRAAEYCVKSCFCFFLCK